MSNYRPSMYYHTMHIQCIYGMCILCTKVQYLKNIILGHSTNHFTNHFTNSVDLFDEAQFRPIILNFELKSYNTFCDNNEISRLLHLSI